MNPHETETYEMQQIDSAQLQEEMMPIQKQDEEETTRFYEHFRF